MPTHVLLLALISAILHAIWNTLARSRPDPGFGYAAMVFSAGLLGMPLLGFIGIPDPACFPYVVGSCLFNLATMRLTMLAYNRLPLSLAYPISRAAAPLFVGIMQILIFNEEAASPAIMVGMGVICSAILLLGVSAKRGDRVDQRGLLIALLAGVFTGAVVLVDSHGIRLAGQTSDAVIGYGAMASILNAIMLLVTMGFEGSRPRAIMRHNFRFGLIGSLVSLTSFILILKAYQFGPVAPASAVRETSVVFATAFAAWLLKEQIDRLRWLAVLMALGGIVIIRIG
jgi:drug/metabolite transporter (DMT)-like permease